MWISVGEKMRRFVADTWWDFPVAITAVVGAFAIAGAFALEQNLQGSDVAWRDLRDLALLASVGGGFVGTLAQGVASIGQYQLERLGWIRPKM